MTKNTSEQNDVKDDFDWDFDDDADPNGSQPLGARSPLRKGLERTETPMRCP